MEITQADRDLLYKYLCMVLPYKPNVFRKGQRPNAFMFNDSDSVKPLTVITLVACTRHDSVYTPILRSLDNVQLLAASLERQGAKKDAKALRNFASGKLSISDLKFSLVLSLLEEHIDIFGFIGKGQAIDFAQFPPILIDGAEGE
jgi:hypothetical protein